jgi:hypothetical protein
MVYNNNYCSIEDAWGNLTDPVPSKDRKKKKKVRDPICDLYEMSTSGNYNELDIIKASNDFEKYNKSKYQRDRQAGRERKKYVTIDANMFDNEPTPLYEQKVSDDMDLEKQFNNAMYSAQCSKSNIKMPDLESHFNPITRPSLDEEADDESEADFQEFKSILDKKMKTESTAMTVPRHLPQTEDFSDDEDTPPPHRRQPKQVVEEQFVDDDVFIRKSQKNTMPFMDLMLYIVSGVILIFVMEQFVKIGIVLQS